MIPLDTIVITKTKLKDNPVIEYEASLTIKSIQNISIASIQKAKLLDMEEHIKEGLVLQIWRLVYGDLQEPINQLIHIAKLADPKYSETADLQRIIYKLEALLK